eukprot:scaffold2835_cov105-Isochrysis_galbana.AAC.15
MNICLNEQLESPSTHVRRSGRKAVKRAYQLVRCTPPMWHVGTAGRSLARQLACPGSGSWLRIL